MVNASIQSAIALIKHLVWYQSKSIRDKYEDKSAFSNFATKSTFQNTIQSARSTAPVSDPANDFVEYNLSKHIDFLKAREEQKAFNPDNTIKEFMMRKEYFPLYMHSKL